MATVEEQKKQQQYKINGVDNATNEKLGATYTPSENVTQAQANAGNALNTLQTNANNAANNGIVSKDTWNKINQSYHSSSTVKDAYATTQALLDKLTSGRTSYSDRVDQMINDIMAKPDFSYDPDTDTLFQQKLASSINSGKQAMQDTMGQAAQLTGGYGSTYATSAANQAYNDYLSQAYDALPEYYQMARDTYQMDMDNAYKKYGMLSDADDREFNRTYIGWQANNTNWQELYNQEYNEWKDGVNFALQGAGLQLNESNAIYDRLQGSYNASQNYSDSLYNREYGQYQDSVSQAFNLANLENSDYWKKYNADHKGSGSSSSKKDKTNSKGKQLDQYSTKNMIRASETNPEGFVKEVARLEALGYDMSDFKTLYQYTKGENKNNDGDDLKIASQATVNEAVKRYEEGGYDALDKYINSLADNIDKDDLDRRIVGAGVPAGDEEEEEEDGFFASLSEWLKRQ